MQSKLDRLKIADEIARLAYSPPERIGHRLAFETIRDHHAAACAEWGAVIARFGALRNATATNVELPEEHDELYDWLDSEGACGHKHNETFVSRWSIDAVELYRCSSCGNASAALRKCSRCGTARYCDQAWQVVPVPLY